MNSEIVLKEYLIKRSIRTYQIEKIDKNYLSFISPAVINSGGGNVIKKYCTLILMDGTIVENLEAAYYKAKSKTLIKFKQGADLGQFNLKLATYKIKYVIVTINEMYRKTRVSKEVIVYQV